MRMMSPSPATPRKTIAPRAGHSAHIAPELHGRSNGGRYRGIPCQATFGPEGNCENSNVLFVITCPCREVVSDAEVRHREIEVPARMSDKYALARDFDDVPFACQRTRRGAHDGLRDVDHLTDGELRTAGGTRASDEIASCTRFLEFTHSGAVLLGSQGITRDQLRGSDRALVEIVIARAAPYPCLQGSYWVTLLISRNSPAIALLVWSSCGRG